jgi:hypothetical protein
MSALPPKADIRVRRSDVRFVPKADSCSAANNDGHSINLSSVSVLGRCGRESLLNIIGYSFVQ